MQLCARSSITEGLDSTKLVGSPVDNRSIIRPGNLIGNTTPLRIINAINPVLGLDNEAAVLVNGGGTSVTAVCLVALSLGLLGGDAAVLAAAGVDLDGSLVGGDIESDTSAVGRGTDGGDHGVGGVRGGTVDQEAGVVAGAAGAAETGGLLNVLADRLGAGEVQ